MGWTLGDQLGEVIAVSHRNHVIVEKYLRVRVEIPLHEPLKNTIEFTPLGCSKESKFDVKYEKLPLYCECCGLVGHTSERFCSIPKEKRSTIYPNNLSVEAYWMGQGSSKRATHFGGFPRSGEPLIVGFGNKNPPTSMEGMVGKVATTVSGLTVSGKDAAPSDKAAALVLAGASQPCSLLVQEGWAMGASLGAPLGVVPGQEGQAVPQPPPLRSGQEGQAVPQDPPLYSGQEGQAVPQAPPRCSGQEGQGLETLPPPPPRMVAAQGQEGQGSRQVQPPSSKLATAEAGTSQWRPAGQEDQGRQPLGASGPPMADAAIAVRHLLVPGQEGQSLFQLGSTGGFDRCCGF